MVETSGTRSMAGLSQRASASPPSPPRAASASSGDHGRRVRRADLIVGAVPGGSMITVGYRWSGAIVDLDRVHMLGVKSGVSLYGRDRVVRSRVGPHRVRGNAVTQLEV